jgi:hypothetical protein
MDIQKAFEKEMKKKNIDIGHFGRRQDNYIEFIETKLNEAIEIIKFYADKKHVKTIDKFTLYGKESIGIDFDDGQKAHDYLKKLACK